MKGPILTAFVIYLLYLVAVGMVFRRKSNNVADFFLGGRVLGSWTTAFSAGASDMSSWLMMSLPAALYMSGLHATWIAVGLVVGTYLNWRLVAARLRRFSQAAGDSLTLPQYLQNRFFSSSVVLRSVCAGFIAALYLIYTASVFRAGGQLLTYVLGYDYPVSLAIGGVILLLYTFMGGFLAVSWTNLFQASLMLGALVALPLVIVAATPASAALFAEGFFSGITNLFTYRPGGEFSSVDLLSGLAWGLGYFGMPHILIHFMGMRTSQQVKKSRFIGMAWVVLCLASAVTVGLLGRIYLDALGKGYQSFAAAEYLFIDLSLQLVPGLGSGILLSAIMAAAMSTADSQLLVTASVVANDLYKTVINPNTTEKQMMRVSRGAVLGISVLAYLLALTPRFSVMTLAAYAWAGFGAGLGPVILLSLYWRRMTTRGAIAGIIAGGGCVLLWELLPALSSMGIYSLLPGFVLGMVFCILFSLLDAPPPPQVEQLFEQAAKPEPAQVLD